jgi:hypothetical protein
MIETILCIIVILAILAFLYWKLYWSNMDAPPGAEQSLGAKASLQFALDNDLPVRSPPGIGHNGGPPISEWW